MIIEKNGVIYLVKETASSWVLEMAIDSINVTYTVSKVDCPLFEGLKEFVAESDSI